MKKTLLAVAVLCGSLSSFAQNLTDGLMMPKGSLCTGFVYTQDKWTNYWEGELKRENGNIGDVTTSSVMWMGAYGVIDKLNIIGMLPYIQTKASMGTLTGMKGIQDLSIAAKYRLLEMKNDTRVFRSYAVVNFSTPIGDYTPDFLPLSIGLHTTNLQYRLTTFFKMNPGIFVNASAGYTWRSNTKLDRPSYYDGHDFYQSNEVKMPNVFDLVASIGYLKGPLQAELTFMQQNTLGGYDIRRQDMPFASNRMNYSKGGVTVQYYVPAPKGLAVRGGAYYTLAGRNVGQSTTFSLGALYTIKFSKPE